MSALTLCTWFHIGFAVPSIQWESVSPAAKPSGRGAAASAVDTTANKLYIFGGEQGMHDFWRFDYSAGTWEQIVKARCYII